MSCVVKKLLASLIIFRFWTFKIIWGVVVVIIGVGTNKTFVYGFE